MFVRTRAARPKFVISPLYFCARGGRRRARHGTLCAAAGSGAVPCCLAAHRPGLCPYIHAFPFVFFRFFFGCAACLPERSFGERGRGWRWLPPGACGRIPGACTAICASARAQRARAGRLQSLESSALPPGSAQLAKSLIWQISLPAVPPAVRAFVALLRHACAPPAAATNALASNSPKLGWKN